MQTQATTDLIPTSTEDPTGTLALDTDSTTSGVPTSLNPPAPTTTASYKTKFIMSLVGTAVLIMIVVLVLVIAAVTCWRCKYRNTNTTSRTATELQDADSVYYSEIGCPVPLIFLDRQINTSNYVDKGTKHTSSNFLMKKNSAYMSTKAPSTTDCNDINVSMNYAYRSTGRKIPNYKYSMEANIAYGIPSRT